MLMVPAHYRAQVEALGNDEVNARLVEVANVACVLSRLAANSIAIEMGKAEETPIELGEMFEDIANVFLALSETVRLRQSSNGK